MTFAQPHLLWLLALPAALMLATAFARGRVSANPHPKIPRAQIRSGQWSAVIGRWSFSPRPLAACLALACLVLALARPQGAAISTPSFVQARDVLVAVDVSRSMLADDVPPTRLARARLLVRDLADDLRGERLGLLPFAGTAFLQSPLSADYEIFRTFVDELGPDMIPVGGSDFAGLLRVAADAFGPAPAAGDGAPAPDRYLIILSDGEAENDAWHPLAQRLAERGVRVIALGLGTSAGAMVPDKDGGLAKDARGAAVLSRLNPATLQELARATDGAYRDASTWVDLPALLKETVARGHAARASTEQTTRRRELFPWFLAPALLLLACSLVREFPPVPRASRPIPRPAPATVARLILLALGLHCIAGLPPSLLAAGAEPAPAPASAPAPDPLLSLVEKLSASAELSAPDLARLATLSAERGEQGRAEPKNAGQFPEGAIRDALAAVSAGQSFDPRAADWPALRKRLEALLAPPPQQQQQQQQQKQQQNPKQQDQSQKSPDQQPQSSDPSDSPNPPEKSQPNQSQSKSQSDESKSDSKSGGDSSSGSPDKSSSQNASAGSPPKPAGDKPLGDLASAPKPEPKTDSPDKAPAPTPPSASDPADEPAQQAGGVSASGRPTGPDSAADTAAIDPALVVPQQRLDRIRNADSPARLFQLLQDSETPPEERERRAAGSKQTW